MDFEILAIAPEYAGQWRNYMSGMAAGGTAQPFAVGESPTQRQAGVAVLPVRGMIVPRATYWSGLFGMTGLDQLAGSLAAALADSEVGEIVLDIDSPGGSVAGVAEMAERIYQARGVKPITAVVNHLAASAGYWLASAAGSVVVSESAEVGSIGVYAMHANAAGMLEKEGVQVTLISAGEFKTEGNPYQPLSDAARAAIQGRIDRYYGQFVGDVARFRGRTDSDVRDNFGRGRIVGMADALTAGMADRRGDLAGVLVNRPVSDVERRSRRMRALSL